jgi:GNAT superfamily N-acetyltransferase
LIKYIGGIELNNIQCLKDDNLRSCAELYVEVFNSAPWNDDWTLDTAYKRLHDIFMTPNFVGVVYEEDNKIKGAVFGNCEYWYQGMHYNLKEMFVSQKFQGTGIGSKLLKAVQESIKEYNVNTLILFTSKGNKTSDFYKKNAFNELESMAMMAKNI